MDNEIRHFVLTQDGKIREFSTEEAASIGTGISCVPEFADHDLHYLQVSLSEQTEGEIRVQTAGASIHFDDKGRLSEAHPTDDNDSLSRFEHDTCVQWALRNIAINHPVFH